MPDHAEALEAQQDLQHEQAQAEALQTVASSAATDAQASQHAGQPAYEDTAAASGLHEDGQSAAVADESGWAEVGMEDLPAQIPLSSVPSTANDAGAATTKPSQPVLTPPANGHASGTVCLNDSIASDSMADWLLPITISVSVHRNVRE